MGDMTIFEECIALGPWGGSEGKNWNYMPQGFIKKISIVYSIFIGCIKFHNGTQTFSFGGTSTANNTATICIQSPNEYLTSICGLIGYYEGIAVLTSLSFYTNQRQFGSFGYGIGGTPFSYDGEGGMIVGFHGRQGKYINAIGIYLMPKSLGLYRTSTLEDVSKHQLFRMGMPREVGPWGASEGKLWDDGVFSNVKQVSVHLGKSSNVIYGIQFEYVKRDATSISSPLHGKTAEKTDMVNLDGTHEYLIGISGFYGPVEGFSGSRGVISLAFHTNNKMYGPYGKERGEAGYVYFTSTASPGKIVGFHGRKGDFLSAIGVHMEYF